MAQEIKAMNPWTNNDIQAKVTITPKTIVTITPTTMAKRFNARRQISRFNFVRTTGHLLAPDRQFSRIDSISGSIRHRVAGSSERPAAMPTLGIFRGF